MLWQNKSPSKSDLHGAFELACVQVLTVFIAVVVFTHFSVLVSSDFPTQTYATTAADPKLLQTLTSGQLESVCNAGGLSHVSVPEDIRVVTGFDC
jgi:hypothetical protein